MLTLTERKYRLARGYHIPLLMAVEDPARVLKEKPDRIPRPEAARRVRETEEAQHAADHGGLRSGYGPRGADDGVPGVAPSSVLQFR